MFDVLLLKEMCDKHAWEWSIESYNDIYPKSLFVISVYSNRKKAKYLITDNTINLLKNSEFTMYIVNDLESNMLRKE